ncbi:hypothetical protein, partial [Streptomyces syringium]|uniref:hypothetical protein n=1 Tax=Streptomyces syringium TaxID=76729 RepID=UPI003AAB1749
GSVGGMAAGLAGALHLAQHLPGLSKVADKIQSPRAEMVLIATASCAMAGSSAGHWLHDGVTKVDDMAVSLVGEWTGMAVTGVPALLLTLVTVSDFASQEIKTRSLVFAAVLPVLAVTIPGVVGDAVTKALGVLVNAVGSVIGFLFGIG